MERREIIKDLLRKDEVMLIIRNDHGTRVFRCIAGEREPEDHPEVQGLTALDKPLRVTLQSTDKMYVQHPDIRLSGA